MRNAIRAHAFTAFRLQFTMGAWHLSLSRQSMLLQGTRNKEQAFLSTDSCLNFFSHLITEPQRQSFT